ncbi:MAG: 2-hydroxyglutaryl-CoA dehydratase [Fusobacteriia bacterium 4572_74]|nr:MAG: 2-hydroxyglutaryl-CoA dehydratase [Fusobacteriia bacterium 4572_74]
MKKIGLTTTVPIEVLLAAGYTPIDLNNIFVVSEDYGKYIEKAERDGFPKSMCAWIKGIYGACIENKIKKVLGVAEGDCSNTKTLLEIFKKNNIKIHPFCYPHSHSLEDIKNELDKFMKYMDVSYEEVEYQRNRLNLIREKAKYIDKLTLEGKATGFENHILQLCFSDFDGDVDKYNKFLDEKIKEINKRPINKKELKLGYLGIPPMQGDLHNYVEELDGRFIYNEVQREFAFPRAMKAKNIYEQYYDYTYTYDIDFRLDDIKKQIKERQLDAVIHYTQAFCHRAVEDIILKQELNIPILTIEGDKSNVLDARTKLRIEAFLDMLKDKKKLEKINE